MPDDPAVPVVTTLVCFVLFCMRGYGCGGHPAFPTPFVIWAHRSCTPRAQSAPRECGGVSDENERVTLSLVIARLDRATQYSRDVDDGNERPRRTGYPACAEYDGSFWSERATLCVVPGRRGPITNP